MVPLVLDTCQANGTRRNHWRNDGNDQTTLEILEILRRLWDVAEPLKRWDWTPIFWHLKGLTLAVEFAHFSTGDNAQTANQVKWAQILECTHSIRTPFVIAADFKVSPTSCGRLAGYRAWAPRPTLLCRRGGAHALQATGELWILLSSQTHRNPSGGESHVSTIRRANHTLGHVQFTATLAQVRGAGLFAFSKSVEEVVPSRKRMKSKTKSEEPTKKEVKFVCKAEQWDSAKQIVCKTRAEP